MLPRYEYGLYIYTTSEKPVIYSYIKSKGIYQPENLMSNGSSSHDDATQTKFVDRKFCQYIFYSIFIGIVAQSSRLLYIYICIISLILDYSSIP